MDLHHIEHNGRAARRAGLMEMENPYFMAENMPRRTGDSFDEWQLKVEAWEHGWHLASEDHDSERRRL